MGAVGSLSFSGNTVTSTADSNLIVSAGGDGKVLLGADFKVTGTASFASLSVDSLKIDGTSISNEDDSGDANIRLSPGTGGKVVVAGLGSSSGTNLQLSAASSQKV